MCIRSAKKKKEEESQVTKPVASYVPYNNYKRRQTNKSRKSLGDSNTLLSLSCSYLPVFKCKRTHKDRERERNKKDQSTSRAWNGHMSDAIEGGTSRLSYINQTKIHPSLNFLFQAKIGKFLYLFHSFWKIKTYFFFLIKQFLTQVHVDPILVQCWISRNFFCERCASFFRNCVQVLKKKNDVIALLFLHTVFSAQDKVFFLKDWRKKNASKFSKNKTAIALSLWFDLQKLTK